MLLLQPERAAAPSREQLAHALRVRALTANKLAGSAAGGIRRALRTALDDGVLAPPRAPAGASVPPQGFAPRPSGSRSSIRAQPAGFSRRPGAPMNRHRVRAEAFTERARRHGLRPRAPIAREPRRIVPLPRRDPVSPELALVDPELAALERLRLHEPGWFAPTGGAPTSTRVGAPARPAVAARASSRPARAPGPAFTFRPRWAIEGGFHRAAVDWPLRRPAPWESVPTVRERAAGSARPGAVLSREHRRHLVTTAAALVAGAGSVGLLWLAAEQTPPVTLADPPTASPPAAPAVSVPGQSAAPGPSGREPAEATPPAAAPAEPGQPRLVPAISAPAPAAKPAPAPPPPSARPQVPPPAPPQPVPEQPASKPAAAPPAPASSRTLAWAPVEGVSGYQVELFRNSRRVLSERTSQPRLSVGGSWLHEGERFSFEPGSYRWYVWPVRQDGSRGGVAIVRARLVIGSS